VKERKFWNILRTILIGKRYSQLDNIGEQVRYLTMNGIFMVAIIPLVVLGTTLIGVSALRVGINYFIAFLCLLSLILIRSKISLNKVPVFPVSVFGAYCLYLLFTGDFHFWAGIWLLAFPPIVFFLCRMTVGFFESVLVFIVMSVILFTQFGPVSPGLDISSRIILAYILIFSITVIYERISILKDRKEAALLNQLAQERDVIQTMKDNLNQGIFMMDSELKILPQYSKPLISILSYYDSELEGKNLLDILSASLDVRQLQTMKGYFAMVFSKSKTPKVLEAANPISEFEYKVDDRLKTLTTRFNLVEQVDSEPVIIGILQDITKEKEFERELQAQREAQELEMKNMFDVIQVDPLVFQDFLEDTESNFNFINAILKDRSLTPKQVLIKFYQNIHAMKANAVILGLESFAKHLHTLEDEVKNLSDQENVTPEDVLDLAFKLETVMQEKDGYARIIKKVEAFQTSNQIDTVLVHSLTKAVEKLASETQKKVELKPGQIDISILESKLRKPIKDILFQCIRNSIYHGIEPIDERIKKNKKPLSLLVFSIKNIDDKAVITFSDDGSGFNWEKIKTKYLASHPGSQNVDKKALLSTVFSPEFSTADETTMLAGRGVGLSMVRDLIKEYNGGISVDSSDAGLTLKFSFPLTI
jgi:signal transduction histidine kinase